MDEIRVRFAPSPTGTLHLGNARAALFNWLYARHQGANGKFVLRIEDTDRARSTDAVVEQALRVLQWLGLQWDEGPGVEGPFGPYVQHQRLDLHRVELDRLLASGHAYECYETPEELAAERELQQSQGRPPVYSGAHRDLTDAEREAFRAEGRPVSVRFRVPTDGVTVVRDLIHGDVEFENALLGDFIIARGDGTPVYNFAVVVDDIAMKITHVIRGDDHLSNSPRQVLLYEALGAPVPLFAHAPMILGPDGQKLSKRHGAASVEDLDEAGYIPESVRNFLALLGWSRDDDSTVMTDDEMIEAFELTRVKKSPAKFDHYKLRWLNGQKLRAMDAESWASAWERWRDRWVSPDHPDHAAAFACTPGEAALLAQEKVDVLADVPGFLGFLTEPFEMIPDAWDRLTAIDEASTVLSAVIEALEGLASFAPADIEQALRGVCTSLDRKPRVVFGPVRFSVTGRVVTPGLFESIHVLGAERSLARLRSALDRLAVTA